MFAQCLDAHTPRPGTKTVNEIRVLRSEREVEQKKSGERQQQKNDAHERNRFGGITFLDSRDRTIVCRRRVKQKGENHTNFLFVDVVAPVVTVAIALFHQFQFEFRVMRFYWIFHSRELHKQLKAKKKNIRQKRQRRTLLMWRQFMANVHARNVRTNQPMSH